MNTPDTHPGSPDTLPPPLPVTSVDARPAPTDDLRWPALTTILRWLGALTLLAAAICYLVSGWMDASPLTRFGSFLGLTLLLGGGGWFCATRWGDDKGGRTFFALATASLPVHAAQLGAMLFARYGHVTHHGGMRAAFNFTAPGEASLIGAFAVALVTLIPLTYLGFAAMARPAAKRLTTVYLLANAVLLIPVRDPNPVALMGFALLGALVWADHRYFAPQSFLRTWDGVAMRTLLFAPFGLLLARNLVMHGGHSALLLSLGSASLATLLFLGVPRVVASPAGRAFSRAVAMIPAALAWLFLANGLWLDSHYLTRQADLLIPTVFLPWTILLALASPGFGRGGAFMRRLAGLAAVTGALTQLFWFGTPGASLLAVATALTVILGGYAMRERWLFRIGLIGLGVGLIDHVRYALALYENNLWLSLAVTGLGLLLAASCGERYGRALMGRCRRWRESVRQWD